MTRLKAIEQAVELEAQSIQEMSTCLKGLTILISQLGETNGNDDTK